MTDAALIHKFLNGDTGAFNTLVWRWEKPLFNFIYRNLGEQDAAKDVCQTVFIRTFKELKRLRDPDKFSSWIYRIAHNLCKDEFKRRKRHRVVYLDEMSNNEDHAQSIRHVPDMSQQTPEDICHHEQVGEILKEMLQELPEEQRIVVVMKQYQGLKFTEIAAILNQPVNTIKSRLYYGLRALRKMLEASELKKEVLLHEM